MQVVHHRGPLADLSLAPMPKGFMPYIFRVVTPIALCVLSNPTLRIFRVLRKLTLPTPPAVRCWVVLACQPRPFPTTHLVDAKQFRRAPSPPQPMLPLLTPVLVCGHVASGIWCLPHVPQMLMVNYKIHKNFA